MAVPTNLSTQVHVCEDKDEIFLITDLLQAANYTPTGAVRIMQLSILNPDGSSTPAPTALVQLLPDGSGFAVTASALANWNGNFNTLSLVFEVGGLPYNIAVRVVVDPVNDAPEGTDRTIAVIDGSGYVLKVSDFGFTDVVEQHGFKSVRITTVPAAGVLQLNGVTLAAGAEVMVTDITAGRLKFIPAAGSGGDASFTFQVRDDGGMVGCDASDLDATPNTLNFTMPATSSLGDRVWNDANRNGVQDAGEAGVGGVSVLLLGAGNDGTWGTSDDVLRTTTTLADGSYIFNGLNAGQYQVVFGGRTGFEFTTANVGSDAADSDANASGSTGIYTLGHNQTNLTVDAGLRVIDASTASLGDRLWNDTNVNGIQDAGEAGISGVTVQLLQGGSVIGTTVTDGAGNYLFSGLAAGQYQVQFGSKTNYIFTYANIGGNDAVDSDADLWGLTNVVTLAAGQAERSVDAGMAFCDPRTSRLGDRVWFDANGNGIQDSGETGVSGVTVQLLQGGSVIGTTTTGTGGSYSFGGLAAGQYQVQFVGQAGYQFTTANVGSDATDSDASATGLSHVITLGVGESNLTVDAGLKDSNTAALGDRVWFDANRNGLQDSGEVGLSGVTVTLWSAGADGSFGTTDDVRTSTTTNSSGNYLFSGLASGRYAVVVTPKSGYEFTTMGANSSSGNDSDVNASGTSWAYSLAPGQANLTVDAGMVLKETNTACLGDRLWYDANANGIQDATETGIANVTVQLLQGGAVVGSTTTNSTGYYGFSGLAAGSYQVQFGGKTNYQFTTANAGTSDALDSDVGATGLSHVVTLAIGQSDQTVDAGMIFCDPLTASLGDRVWYDTDRDGVQDSTETGISGVMVTLAGAGADGAFGTADDTSRSTITNSSGDYLFSGLASGQYQVTFGGKTGYQFTTANVGSDSADSDANVSTGRSHVVTLGAGESNRTVDAGMVANVCAKIVTTSGATGTVSMNEGATQYFQVTLDTAVTQTTQFWVQVSDGSAMRTGFNASSQIVHANPTRRTTDWSYDPVSYQSGHENYEYRGNSAMTWDFGVYNTAGQLLSGAGATGFYVTIAAGSTTSSSFSVKAWREFVDVDRDGSSNYGTSAFTSTQLYNKIYLEGNEYFNMQLSKTSGDGGVVVCNPATQVNICDTSIYDVTSPIILDLDGNGVQTTALGATQGGFDLLGKGQVVSSGWASAGDGFLAVDVDGNGVIDGIGELFGGRVGEGFAKLRSFDSNGDGVVDVADADFGKLLVWQDANSNHVSDAGELRTLAEVGIAALNTDFVFQNAEQNGNILGETSTAVRVDGSTIEMIDVYFRYESTGVPALESLMDADNALLDQALGGGVVNTQPAIADFGFGFDVASEAQRAILAAMKHVDPSIAVAC